MPYNWLEGDVVQDKKYKKIFEILVESQTPLKGSKSNPLSATDRAVNDEARKLLLALGPNLKRHFYRCCKTARGIDWWYLWYSWYQNNIVLIFWKVVACSKALNILLYVRDAMILHISMRSKGYARILKKISFTKTWTYACPVERMNLSIVFAISSVDRIMLACIVGD